MPLYPSGFWPKGGDALYDWEGHNGLGGQPTAEFMTDITCRMTARDWNLL